MRESEFAIAGWVALTELPKRFERSEAVERLERLERARVRESVLSPRKSVR